MEVKLKPNPKPKPLNPKPLNPKPLNRKPQTLMNLRVRCCVRAFWSPPGFGLHLSGGVSLPYFSDEDGDYRISQPSGFYIYIYIYIFFFFFLGGGGPMFLHLTSVLFVGMSAITSKNLMEPPTPPYLAWFGT